MLLVPRTLTLLATAAGLCACAPGAEDAGSENGVSDYAQGYALAYGQADKMRHIDKLLIVKRESDEVNEVTAEVARISELTADRLREYAEGDSTVVLDREFLPPIEAGARSRMSAGLASELLLTFGCDFEERLLFTEAIAVMRLLAIAEEMTSQAPDDAQRDLWSELAAEYEPVFDRIRSLLNTCEEDR